MIRKKSSFLTFCFSFIPGAGQMYMGFMKRGISLMSVFFLLTFSATWLHIGPLMFIAPVIWFYAFFDTFNLRAMPDDEFYAMEDHYLLMPDLDKEKLGVLQAKYRTVFAIVLIIIGINILWNNFIDMGYAILPEEISYILDRFGDLIPQLFIGGAIVAFGFYLIRGKKKDLDQLERDQLLEDKGGLH